MIVKVVGRLRGGKAEEGIRKRRNIRNQRKKKNQKFKLKKRQVKKKFFVEKIRRDREGGLAVKKSC